MNPKAFTLVLSTSLFFAQSIVPIDGQFDLPRYAITQGGLFAVCLVALYFYRKDFMSRLQGKDEKIQVLTDLVAMNTAAMTRSAAASEANERAAHRLSRALDNLEERNRRS